MLHVERWSFATTNKVENKSAEIVNSFTNKILEQDKEKVVTRGTHHFN
jgi:hypothetical protein